MYGTVGDANDWLDLRGLGPVDEAELTVASDWIDAVYGGRFVGVPTGEDAWPRKGAVDCWGRSIADNEVPDAIKHAAWLVAGKGLAHGGMTYIRGAQSVREGQLSVTWATGEGAAARGAGLVDDPMVDALLGCYLHKGIPVRLV